MSLEGERNVLLGEGSGCVAMLPSKVGQVTYWHGQLRVLLHPGWSCLLHRGARWLH